MSDLEHDSSKDAMLKSQLGIYGKAPPGMGRSPRSKKEPEREPYISPEEKEAERRRVSRARKAEEMRAMMNADSDDEEVSLADRLAASSSRSSKKRSSKNRDSTKRRSSTRSGRSSQGHGEVDKSPISITLWVYMIFGFAALDRTVKFVGTHGDPVIVSKILGSVLILAAFGVKVPQILSILESKTVTGLSPAKFYTGVLSLVMTVIYHLANRNAFTAWGDSLAVLLQDIVLVGLIWQYSRTKMAVRAAVSAGIAVFTIALVILALQVRADKLWALPLVATLIAHSGTIPQIIDNERNKHTGPLSFVTQLMLTLGSLARVFTTLSEMNDPVVLGSFISSVIVQGALLVQILMYWKNTNRVLRKAKKD